MIKAFSVRDKKAEGFLPPFFRETYGLGERFFKDALDDEKNPMGKHREDFSLYEVGQFDPKTGLFEPLNEPKLICQGAN